MCVCAVAVYICFLFLLFIGVAVAVSFAVCLFWLGLEVCFDNARRIMGSAQMLRHEMSWSRGAAPATAMLLFRPRRRRRGLCHV